MTKTRILYLAATTTLLLAAVIFLRSFGNDGLGAERVQSIKPTSNASGNGAQIILPTEVNSKPVSEPSRSNPEVISAMVAAPAYELKQAKVSFDPAADAHRRRNLPFRMFASGGTGKIIDTAGNVIASSDATNAIFGCEVSPDQSRIVINRGSAKYDVLSPGTGESVRLPQRPPGEDMLGFESWHWVDNHALVGVSGKTIPFRSDQVGPAREEPNISRSVLYVYYLKEKTLMEVELPPPLRNKVVSVSAVDQTGKVQLRPEGRDVSYTDASLGWFDIQPKK